MFTLSLPPSSLLMVAALSLPGTAVEAQATSTDSIIAHHIMARGGAEAIANIRTLVYRNGTYTEGTFSSNGDAFMAFKRPYYRVVGNPEKASQFSEGYDGASWEWYQIPGVVIRTVFASSGATRRGTDFEGPLVHYREKGATVALMPMASVDGKPAFRLQLTALDGFQREYLIDQESYLIVAERQSAPLHGAGAPVTTETRVSDYRPVAGVLFAHRYEEAEIATGRVLNRIAWPVIEANLTLPDEWFHPPQFAHTPVQEHLELLYFQRGDPPAVLWSMAAFRRAHPDLDTRTGIDFIGLQMLKMGDTTTAILVLEQHARDYPKSASTLYSLGRVYRDAGRPDDARRALTQALVLDPSLQRARAALDEIP